jgi:hypothetical protein
VNTRLKKILLLGLACLLLLGTGQVQRSLNADRDRLGLTSGPVLENAPPVLAFTTVALGGFRGLISNLLWIRANELQQDDKFFEMVQLADWITKLEPHFAQVWTMQAWNMTYNISVKFKDFNDRWRWVKQGIELLRDQGLRYNPNELLLYRELGIFFQHKMGQDLDDANRYYKRAWFGEMSQIFKGDKTDFDELIHPATADAQRRRDLLVNQYKMNPGLMKELDERYGPLDWRLPEAHAIYWAALGLKVAETNAIRVDPADLIQLHRVIYQSMQLAVVHGRVIGNMLDLAPNLDIIPKANAAYEQAMKDDPGNRDSIAVGHRNFLRDAIYYLYTSNREHDAAQWLAYFAKTYPDQPLLEGQPDSLPSKVTLDEYVYGRVEDEVKNTSRDKTRMILQGAILKSYVSLAAGEDDRAAGWELFARRVWARYQDKMADSQARAGLQSLDEVKKSVLQQLLDPQTGLQPELANQLRTALGLPAPTNTDTNLPPPPPAQQ